MSKVTDYITKEKIEKSSAFPIKFEGHANNNYFKSEKDYLQWLENENSKHNVITLLNEIVSKSKYSKLNPIIKRKLDTFLKNYSYLEIEFCLSKFKEEIGRTKDKGLPYLVTVIENKLIRNHETYVSYKRNKEHKVVSEVDAILENKINEYKFKDEKVDVRRWVK